MTEKAYRIVGARVSYVNYEAVRRNYPHTRTMTPSQIDDWILDNYAYLAEGQEKLFGIRTTPIALDKNDVKTLYRPKDSNRSGMLESAEGALADGKGNGHVNSSALDAQAEEGRKILASGDAAAIDEFLDRDHSDGVLTAAEAHHETIQQQRAQIRSNAWNWAHPELPRRETVETLFTIDIPGYALRSHGNKDRLAIYFREPQFARNRAALKSSEFLFNPAPNKYPTGHDTRLENWLQTSPSGAIVDYGATLSTDRLGVKRHKYRAPKLDKDGKPLVNRKGEAISGILKRDELLKRLQAGEYIDSHDSALRQFAFETANGMDRCTESWEVCRSYFETFLRDMTLPTKNSKPITAAPLNPHDQLFVGLFEAAQSNRFDADRSRELVNLIIEANDNAKKGKTWATAEEGLLLRLQHAKVQMIISQLSPQASHALIEEISNRTMFGFDPLPRFLEDSSRINAVNTQGLGDTILPSKARLYDAMIDFKTKSGASPYLVEGYLGHLAELKNGGAILEDPARVQRLIEALSAGTTPPQAKTGLFKKLIAPVKKFLDLDAANIRAAAQGLLNSSGKVPKQLLESQALLDHLTRMIDEGGADRTLALQILQKNPGAPSKPPGALLKSLLNAQSDKKAGELAREILRAKLALKQHQIDQLTARHLNNALPDDELRRIVLKAPIICGFKRLLPKPVRTPPKRPIRRLRSAP